MAFLVSEDVNHATLSEKWHIFTNINGRLRIMVHHCHGVASYAPLYIHSFKLLQPRKLVDAEKFNITFPNPATLTTISDKLRYYRHQKALMQREVADYAGIFRSTYIHYENGMGIYPLDRLEKIAELLDVSIMDLLDEYHVFLWNGQGKQLKALRKERALTQKDVAKLMCVNVTTVKRWEYEKAMMSRKTWEKLFGHV